MQLLGARHDWLNVVWGEKASTGVRAADTLLSGEKP